MRQGGMALLGARHAGVGADRSDCRGGLRTVGEHPPAAPHAAVLMSKTLALTQELMARASVSPTDGGCQAVMIERLELAGFEAERLRFGPVDNFWAKRGHGGPVFWFPRHTDVLPSGPIDSWRTDPFSPVIENAV